MSSREEFAKKNLTAGVGEMSASHKWLDGEKHVPGRCDGTRRQERDVVDVFPQAVLGCSCSSHAGVSSGTGTRSCARTAGTLGRDWRFFQARLLL